jgi:amidase
MLFRVGVVALAGCVGLVGCEYDGAGPVPDTPRVAPTDFDVVEATIVDIHAAMEVGDLTARQLVEAYLARIEAYDGLLNSLILVNPRALARADELDRAFAASGFTGPLHGIPVIVKDNYDTADLPTSAGSASLSDSIPPDDAFQVRQIREAGAIVLAKSNMAEFAFSPYVTVGSRIPGYTRNPYAPGRVTAGSSGGTAAAVAANLGAVGLGTDTGNSIRGPSSHNLLVGIRSTMGLTSRDGIVPLYLDHDVGGPMCRTVADAVAVLDVIAGTDPADLVTAEADDRRPARYADHLVENRLRGARIGVVRQLSDTPSTHPGVLQRFEEALSVMRLAGVEVVDVHIAELDDIPGSDRWCMRFEYDLDNYLASLGAAAPVKSLQEIYDGGRFHPTVRGGIEFFLSIADPPETNAGCRTAWSNGRKLAAGVRGVLTNDRLDALVYPTWSNPPRWIGDMESPAGDNSQDLSPHTGFPAITVPMGFSAAAGPGLPAGITFLGDAWTEPRLIELAYGFERSTGHRVSPTVTPPLAPPLRQRDR